MRYTWLAITLCILGCKTEKQSPTITTSTQTMQDTAEPQTEIEERMKLFEPPAPEIELGCQYAFYNPAPLFIGSTYASQRIENFCISVNYIPDIGAYEYIPPYTAWIPGDFSMNNKVTTYDYYLFTACVSGPAIPHRTTLKFVSGEEVPVGCWLCDFDNDGDVDMSDFGVLQRNFQETYLWGDANQDGTVNNDDITFTTNCAIDPHLPVKEGDPCYRADMNESAYVNDKDIELVTQAVQRAAQPLHPDESVPESSGTDQKK